MTATEETNPARRGTLVVGVLTIESSYAQNTERSAREVSDTLQFWIGSGSAWRIRTYATDHDIHVHSLGDLGKMKDRPIDFAHEHISKHFGDLLASTLVLEFRDISNTNECQRLLREHNLKGSLEVAEPGFAFWNPDDGRYRSQATPKPGG
jgi:hypothetical protein